MKQVLKVAMILTLMFSTLATLIFIAVNDGQNNSVSDSDVTNSDQSQTTLSSAKKDELITSEPEFSLDKGESHKCAVTFADGEAAEGLKWQSSNETVAKVDNSGTVTAVAKGEAVITAYISNNIKCDIKVSVYENVKKSITNAVNNLANYGTDEYYNEIIALENQLNKSKDSKSKNYAALLKNLLAYGEKGAGKNKNTDELWSALESSLANSDIDEIDTNTLKRASLSAYCQGEKSSSDITLSFTGDCTLAYFNETDNENMFPAVYRNSGSVSYPFDLTKNVFGADDITLINLENALTNSTAHLDKQFYFRGDPSYVNILTSSSVEAVTVENNHAFDYLNKGYNDTLNNLKNAKIRYTSLFSPSVINVNGHRIVMLSLSLVSTTYRAEFKKQMEKYISQYQNDKTVIVVNVHWGNEGADVPDEWQIQAAHSMIDAGADLIVGHHPHRLQGIEEYKGHYTAYSLGNFSFGGNSSAKYPKTIILRASFSSNADGGMQLDKISVVPCYTTSSGSQVNDFRPTALFGETGNDVISNLLTLSGKLSEGIKSINWNEIK